MMKMHIAYMIERSSPFELPYRKLSDSQSNKKELESCTIVYKNYMTDKIMNISFKLCHK